MKEDITKMVAEYMDARIYFIDAGKKVAYTEVFDNALLKSTTQLEHRFVLQLALDYLVALGEVDLEFAGVNDEGQTLYERIV